MICPYCGKENPENLDICEFCGGSLTVATEERPTEPYSPEPNVTIIQSAPEVETPRPQPIPAPPQAPGGIRGNRIWWLVGCFVIVLLLLCCAISSLVIYRSIHGLASLLPASITSALTPIPSTTDQVEVLQTVSIPTAPIPPTSIPTTSSPTAANPTFSNSPTSNPGLLLYDDFSNTNSGWDRSDTGDYFTDYYQGAYRIIIHSSMSDSWANPDSNSFGNVIVEVDTTKNSGPDDNDFGVICRYQNMNQFYYAVISSDGYYGITKVTSQSSTILGASELQPSDSIKRGTATNHIRFDCNGDLLTLYVNGKQIDQQTDSEYTSGNVGLIAGTYDTAGTDILFDNFSVSQP